MMAHRSDARPREFYTSSKHRLEPPGSDIYDPSKAAQIPRPSCSCTRPMPHGPAAPAVPALGQALPARECNQVGARHGGLSEEPPFRPVMPVKLTPGNPNLETFFFMSVKLFLR